MTRNSNDFYDYDISPESLGILRDSFKKYRDIF